MCFYPTDFIVHSWLKISESIKRFGVSDASTDVIVIRIGNIDQITSATLPTNIIFDRMKAAVHGTPTKLDKGIAAAAKWDLIRKASF